MLAPLPMPSRGLTFRRAASMIYSNAGTITTITSSVKSTGGGVHLRQESTPGGWRGLGLDSCEEAGRLGSGWWDCIWKVLDN